MADLNQNLELDQNSSASKLWQDAYNKNSYLNVKNEQEEKAKQNYFYGKVNSNGTVSDSVVGPVGSTIKINNELITMSKNIHEVIEKINSARDKYSESYSEFLKHYMGGAEEANSVYASRLDEKLEGLTDVYHELEMLLYLVYKKFETLDNSSAKSFKE